MVGWLVNDCLTCIPNTKTFWHFLLENFPCLSDITNGGVIHFNILADEVETKLKRTPPENYPKFIIRNGTYFRKINTDVPTISIIQDIQIHNHNLFQHQLDVIRNSAVVVFNTNYVYEKYKPFIGDCPKLQIKICPLGIDFNYYTPSHPLIVGKDENPPILYIGDSSTYPKGFSTMLNIINKLRTYNFVLIMKDDFDGNGVFAEEEKHRVKIYNRIGSSQVKNIINSCGLAVCTSLEETQHLSGIECASCDLPIVARNVGVYHDCCDDTRWGMIANDENEFIENIRTIMNSGEKRRMFKPRECFMEKYSNEICKSNWKSIIDCYEDKKEPADEPADEYLSIGEVVFTDDDNISIKLPVHKFSPIFSTRNEHEVLFRQIHTYLIKTNVIKNNIIDLGAWIGDNSIPWAVAISHQPESVMGEGENIINRRTVYSIDPSPENCDFIKKISKLNRIHNVVVLQTAISDKNETLTTTDDLHHCSFVYTNPTSIVNGEHKQQINSVSLDYLYETEKIDNIGYIHLDVEGMEERVILGSTNIINAFHPIITFEQHLEIDDYMGLSKYLMNKNYDVFMINEILKGCRHDCRNFIAFPKEMEKETKVILEHIGFHLLNITP